MATGRFVLEKGRTGKFRFNLLSTNGRVIASSEAYETKRASLAGIAAIQKLAAAARLEDRTEAAAAGKKAAGKKAAAKKSSAPRKAAGTKATARKTAAKRSAPGKPATKRATAKKSGAPRKTAAKRVTKRAATS